MLILTSDVNSHNVVLRKILTALQNSGIKLNKDKCSFFTDNVTYLGYVFDKEGVHPSPMKIQAIRDAPPASDLK